MCDGRERDRHAVLRHGLRRRPRVPAAASAWRVADERAAMYEDMADVLARLHGVDVASIGLGDYGKPGNYYARQIARWSQQYVAAKTDEIPAMDRLMEWLPAAHSARRRDRDRARRLSRREPDLPSHRAAHRGDRRLGAVDAGPSARRSCLQLPDVSPRAGSAWPRRSGRDRSRRHSRRSRRTSRRIAGAPGARKFPTGISISRFRCSGSRASCKASTRAGCKATPRPRYALQRGAAARQIAEQAWVTAIGPRA